MNPRQRRIVIVTAVCVLAISLAAATLDSTVESSTDGGGSDDVSTPPPAPGAEQPAGPVGTVGGPCIPWLTTPWAVLGLLSLLGGGGLLIHRRYTGFEAIAFIAGLGIPALALYLLLTDCATDGVPETVFRALPQLPADNPVGDSGIGSDPAVLFGAVLSVGLLIAALMFYLSVTGQGNDSAGIVDESEDDVDVATAVQSAGEAAERIEDGNDLENEVYRAWHDMAAHLDIARPEASTPGEFATVAIEVGLHPDAVRELTELFEEVRYGSFEATPNRESRARMSLHRIGASYESTVESISENFESDESDG